MSEAAALWARAQAAVALLAVDPFGLGGLHLRARAGPVRDRLTAALGALPLPLRRIHPGIGDDQLFGGPDLVAMLASQGAGQRAGLLQTPCALVLPMAERAPPGLAARLAHALDTGSGHCVIALDEGAEPAEALHPTLADRLALAVDLGDLALSDAVAPGPDAGRIAAARARLGRVTVPEPAVADLVLLALRLGIDGLRAPHLALRATRAAAALAGRDVATGADLELAVALVYASRATRLPATEPDPAPPEPEPEPDPAPQAPDEGQAEGRPPQDMLLEAVRAVLPEDVLARLAAPAARAAAKGAGGSGAAHRGNRRGRPLPSRPGRLDGAHLIDLVATLRAAAPWQRMRGAGLAGAGARLAIRSADIRIRRFEETSDRLLIFVVDASGSAALARLAEAKGAVELLLTEAYARRDHVALVSFRGAGADLLLPATRSLVQTKRRLAALPGGGGTPLAAGLRAGLAQAVSARAHGMTPTLVLLTDGRANIALDGSASRSRAAEDATRLARLCRASGIEGLVIDTAPRPQPFLRDLAAAMGGAAIALPHADARSVSVAVSATLGA